MQHARARTSTSLLRDDDGEESERSESQLLKLGYNDVIWSRGVTCTDTNKIGQT